MLVLGIETSCDETAAAVLSDGTNLLSNVISSQVDIHSKYGGVVPEVASRKHIESIMPVIQSSLTDARVSLDDIDGIAVTRGPGLVGSLMVGLSVAKAMAFAKDIPFVGINHIEAHISAVFLSEKKPEFPFVALVASGGHTHIYLVKDFESFTILGKTRDDAAGEALDKAAKMLNLGYPGGVVIDELSKTGETAFIEFPRAMKGSLDFSFSGLKTSLLNYLKKRKNPVTKDELSHIVASYQEAVVDVLVEKTLKAARESGISRVAAVGGVSSNTRLRQRFYEKAQKENVEIYIPPAIFCTDNAAMTAVIGNYHLSKGKSDSFNLDAVSRWPV